MLKNFRKWRAQIHLWFEVAIFAKFLNGVVELIGGTFLLTIRPETVRRIIDAATSHELQEDPTDLIANYLVHAARNFSFHTQIFGSVFLLSHGVIKILLVVCLWKRKLWAYPTAIVVFGLFCIYQLYRYSIVHAPELIVLTVVDLAIIILTWFEYGQHKAKLLKA